jgi:hypothetical protein
MKRLFSSPYHLSPWPDLFRPPTSFAKYSAEHKKSWMPTELVRGLKAHGTSLDEPGHGASVPRADRKQLKDGH